MQRAAASLALLLGLGGFACGGGMGGGLDGEAPASVVIGSACSVSGVRIEVEAGVLGGADGQGPCAASGALVATWRRVYEERWGTIPLGEWTVRIREPELLDGAAHAGLTWYGRRLIEISQGHVEVLPHELHHAQLGEGSSDHHGWCADFVPWELARHVQDERSRLGCTP